MSSFKNSENPEVGESRESGESSNKFDGAGVFLADKPLYRLWLDRAWQFIIAQKTLFEAFWVAVSLHIVMFPVLWFIGWALPWPKPPVVTTIVEYDLQAWLKTGKPKRVFEFRDPVLNE